MCVTLDDTCLVFLHDTCFSLSSRSINNIIIDSQNCNNGGRDAILPLQIRFRFFSAFNMLDSTDIHQISAQYGTLLCWSVNHCHLFLTDSHDWLITITIWSDPYTSNPYLMVVFINIICAAQDWFFASFNGRKILFFFIYFCSTNGGRALCCVSWEIISSLSCHGASASIHPVLSKHMGLFSGWCLQIWPLVLLPCSQERNARSAQDDETAEWMTSYPITCHLYTGPASGLEETTWDKQLHGKRFWSPRR